MTTGASPRTTTAAGIGVVTVIGATTPSDAEVNPTTAVDTSAKVSFWNGARWERWLGSILSDTFADPGQAPLVGSLGMVWDTIAATWIRPQALNVASDAIVDWALAIPLVGAAKLFWNTAEGKWSRTNGVDPANDALVNPAVANPSTSAFVLAWDSVGTAWRRLQTDTAGALKASIVGATTPSDAEANPTTAVNTSAKASFWDTAGGTWKRLSGVALTDALTDPAVVATVGALGMVWDKVAAKWIRPQAINVASDAITNWALAIPLVGAVAVAYDSAGGAWRRLLTDAAGALKVAPVAVDSSVLFPTAGAPADAASNATTVSKVGTEASLYNGTTWDRIRGSLGGITSGVLATWTGVPHSLSILRYLSTRPTLATGEGTHHQSNTRGDLAVEEQRQENAFANSDGVCVTAQKKVRNTNYSTKVLVQDYATTVTRNASTTQNVVSAVFVTNRNAAVRYFQLHNTATTPGGGATAAISIAVPPGTAFMLIGEDFFGPQGFCPGTSGVAYAWSTVAATYTAGTAADHDTLVMGGG